MTQYNTSTRGWHKALLLVLFLLCLAVTVFADPSGSTVSGNTTVTGPVVAPAFRNESRGTITTMVLSAIQQDQHWKAYVGNISGGLTLDNPAQATIYSWNLASVTGQVYASRNSSVNWASGNIVCASATVIGNESIFNNMSASATDRVNMTFNWTVHKQFQIGSNTIAQSTCNSTAMYVNDTKQTPTITSPFQEVLIMDSASLGIIYMASIDSDMYGYDNTTYDFQMIVAESDVKAAPTPYYFYVELR